tara:strand:- start:1 stop:102 length:102 start_codon:yes stop_codon:yes gene_type:complete
MVEQEMIIVAITFVFSILYLIFAQNRKDGREKW